MTSGLAEIAMALVVLIAVAGIAVALHRRSPVPVDDGPEDEIYRVFTQEFDRTIPAKLLPASLREASPDGEKGYLEKDDRQWRAQIDRAEDVFGRMADPLPLEAGQADTLCNAAILIMVDQSGSLRGEPMAWVAAGVRRLSEELCRRGANVAVAGFTTAGWHGGFAQRKWRGEGRPSRPGRLCALLHILYKPFDSEELDENDWRHMLNPDVLRENVDGEALEWGRTI
jgi:cobaltochelatase CobT